MRFISIIICCFNSSIRIRKTLSHIVNLEIPLGFSYEIILVDNNSSDDTTATALNYWKILNTSVPLKIVSEIRPGLSFARRKGLSVCKGEYIILCDDDNWLSKDYLTINEKLFDTHPEVGIIGGNGKAVYEIIPEKWFTKNNLARGLAIGKQAHQSGEILHKKKVVYGAGMVIRKKLFLEILNKPILLSDRKGTRLSSGGDSELCYLAILAGYKLWFEESLSFQHYIPTNRCTIEYQKRLFYSKGYSAAYLKLYQLIINNDPYLNKKYVWGRILYRKLYSFINLFLNNNSFPIKKLSILNMAGYLIGHLSLTFRFNSLLKKIKYD